jgi:hypothetical protein
MKKTIDFQDFAEEFKRYNRADDFTREGLRELFDYFEECDPDLELDVIAICCDYHQSEWHAIANDYLIDLSECDNDKDAMIDAVRDYLSENTCVVAELDDGSFVFAAF